MVTTRSWCAWKHPAWKSRISIWKYSTTIWSCAARSRSNVSGPRATITSPSAPTAGSNGRYRCLTRWTRPRLGQTTRTVYCGSSCPSRPCGIVEPSLLTCTRKSTGGTAMKTHPLIRFSLIPLGRPLAGSTTGVGRKFLIRKLYSNLSRLW